MKTKVEVLVRRFLPFCLLMYAALVSFHGYHYADVDASETSASALHLSDASLYEGDLYIEHTSKTKLNERYPFVLLLHFLGASSPWTYFFMHLACSCLLLAALSQLASHFLKHRSTSIIFLITCLFLTYGYTLGENEIWYNYLMPSLPAKALGACALVLYLFGHRYGGYILLIFASLSQPIAGAQLALIFLILDLWRLFQSSQRSLTVLLPPMLYGAIAGFWILLVFMEQTQLSSHVTDRQFFEIMELRLGHHFFPSYYPTSRWMVMSTLTLASLCIWSKSNRVLYRFTQICLVGYVLYVVGVEWLEIPNLLVLQWFKTTVWVKVIGLLALFSWAEQKVGLLANKWLTTALYFVLFISVAGPIILPKLYTNKPYHFPWVEVSNPAHQLANFVMQTCPKEASIITPPEMTELRYFSRRGVFIDYKSNIHSRSYLLESHVRREKLYGLTLQLKQSGKTVAQSMQQHYTQLSLDEILSWKSEGATHIVTYSKVDLALPRLYSNTRYSLYKL